MPSKRKGLSLLGISSHFSIVIAAPFLVNLNTRRSDLSRSLELLDLFNPPEDQPRAKALLAGEEISGRNLGSGQAALFQVTWDVLFSHLQNHSPRNHICLDSAALVQVQKISCIGALLCLAEQKRNCLNTINQVPLSKRS